MSDALKAPFPWFGGKSRAASLIWDALGDVTNYIEPFAGSLATLLRRPHAPHIETVNDLDCYVANFWRAASHDAEAVARFADYPVNEADLHARHTWLVNQHEWRERMLTDPDYYDAKVAGWWCWS
jgi:site-specific DNA-adenine methylase